MKITVKNSKKQAIIASVLGDGNIIKSKATGNCALGFSCIHKESVKHRVKLLGGNVNTIRKCRNSGYKKKSTIYRCHLKQDEDFKTISNMSLKEMLSNLDRLGLAMWFLDDGSFHKTKHFYNLCTHSFTEKEHLDDLIPFFKSIGLEPKLRRESKKDGRSFCYLSFNKRDSAVLISDAIEDLRLECANFKVMPNNAFVRHYKYNGEYFQDLGAIVTTYNIKYWKVQKLVKDKVIVKCNGIDVQRLNAPDFWCERDQIANPVTESIER